VYLLVNPGFYPPLNFYEASRLVPHKMDALAPDNRTNGRVRSFLYLLGGVKHYVCVRLGYEVAEKTALNVGYFCDIASLCCSIVVTFHCQSEWVNGDGTQHAVKFFPEY